MRKPTPNQTPEQDIADTLEGIKATIGVIGNENITSLAELVFSSRNINLALVAIFAQLVALEKRLADPSSNTTQDFAQAAIDKMSELKNHPQFTPTFVQPGSRG